MTDGSPADATDVLAEVAVPGDVRIVIRRAVADDAPALLAYLRRVGAESDFLSFGAEGPPISEADERVFLAGTATSVTAIMLVAIRDGEIVGSLGYKAGDRARTRHVGEFGISVARSAQGIGLGRRLMEAFLAWARAGGIVRKINLRVRPDNAPAIALYESLGFALEGRFRRDLLIDGVFHDSLAMGLLIDPPAP